MDKKTITFESLKNKIKKSFNAYDLVHIHAGEYIFDRMLQLCGKQEMPEGGISVYKTPQQLNKVLYDYIDNVDVRSVGDLIAFCKEAKIVIPNWLNKGYGIDLTDKGWVLYEK